MSMCRGEEIRDWDACDGWLEIVFDAAIALNVCAMMLVSYIGFIPWDG